VCAKLGLEGGRVRLSTGSGFGTSALPILLAGLSCGSGTEAELSACLYSTNTAGCTHGQDVGVVCNRPPVEEVKLVGVSKQKFAVVQLSSGKFGKVCRDGVTTKEARVICAQAGLTGGSLLAATAVEPPS
jgi:hypothetical protein